MKNCLICCIFVLINLLSIKFIYAQIQYIPDDGTSFNDEACFLNMKLYISPPNVCNTDPYILVFEDDFAGNSLNHTNWWTDPYNAGGLPRCADWVPNCWYLPDNVQVTNGTLNLITDYSGYTTIPYPLPDPYDNNCLPYNHYDCFNDDFGNFPSDKIFFESGEVSSTRNFGQGIYEIYCKLPEGDDIYPSFWMFGVSSGNSNEIDVFENFDNETDHKLRMNVHYDGKNCDYSPGLSCHLEEGYHKVTVLWNDWKIQYSVDGSVVRTYYKYFQRDGSGPPQFSPIDCDNARVNPHYENDNFIDGTSTLGIILGNGTGPLTSCGITTPFPNSFDVQYVRYYKQIPSNTCSSDINISDQTTINTYLHPVHPWGCCPTSEDYSSVVGHTITFAGANSVNFPAFTNGDTWDAAPNIQLEAIASSSIDLLPGFDADANDPTLINDEQYDPLHLLNTINFEARIDPNLCNNYNPNSSNGCPPLATRLSNEGSSNTDSLNKTKSINTFYNYPNPFKEQTTIEYNLTDKLPVILTVYNAYGVKLKQLVNTIQPAGNYKVIFNGTDFDSGVYYYTINEGNKSMAGKMVLMK